MDLPVEMIELTGFDPNGEPWFWRMADDRLYIAFNNMPPSRADDALEQFADFDRQLAAAAGVAVEWEDRESFRLARLEPDTIDRIRAFLLSYPRPGRKAEAEQGAVPNPAGS